MTSAATAHPDLEPLAWLLGTWEGTGAWVWPDEPDRNVVVELVFETDGGPAISYLARTWELTADGTRGEPGPSESGFWRKGPDKFDVEVVISRSDGAVAVLVGNVAFKRVELASDLVARTQAAGTETTAMARLYGGVEGDLAFVLEQADPQVSLRPYLSARLTQREGKATPA